MSCFLFFYEVYHETKIYSNSIVQEVKNYGYRETLPNVIIMTKPTKRTEKYTKRIQNRCFTLAKYQLLILTHRYLKPYLNLDKKHRTATHSPSSSHFAFQTSGEPDLLRFHSPNRAQWPSWRKGPCVLSWHFRWVRNYKAERKKNHLLESEALESNNKCQTAAVWNRNFFNATNVDLVWFWNSKMQNLHRIQHHQWRWSSDQWCQPNVTRYFPVCWLNISQGQPVLGFEWRFQTVSQGVFPSLVVINTVHSSSFIFAWWWLSFVHNHIHKCMNTVHNI